MNDDYLWHGDRSLESPEARGSGESEESREFRRLEAALSRYRQRPEQNRPHLHPTTTDVEPPARIAAFALLAVAASLFVGFFVIIRDEQQAHSPDHQIAYLLEDLVGRAQVLGADGRPRSGNSVLSGGDQIVCGDDTRARLSVGRIGSVVVEPHTRLSIDAETDYSLFLERGTMSASIFAAPRLFQVGTPSGIAVDLGCIYEATVDEQGDATLRVISGAVSFESDGRKVHVPSGAECQATTEHGPGTPVWGDAPLEYKQAVARLDGADTAPKDSIERVLFGATLRDTLTLWHLLTHPDRNLRKRALGRLLVLLDPETVEALDLAKLSRSDPEALKDLRLRLDRYW